ncbi:hypothetical protein ACLIMJ_02090 [Pseudomonas veronii]|jgi:hypothetical protein|uniref:hypothetical protein n=1 Tax=Pseudomonas veronii TaxID=76761 RepID=UPI003982A1E5
MAGLSVIGWRLVQGLCLLLMFISASVCMLVWDYFDSSTASAFGTALGIFLMCSIGLLFAFVFERSRTPSATVRYLMTRCVVVLVLAAGAAYVADAMWFAPEREALDAALEGASKMRAAPEIIIGS